MITEIGYADGRYFIWADGHCVDSASTQHDADVLLSSIQEAEAIWQMGGMETTEDTDTKINQPTGWCYICGCAAWEWNTYGPLCPDHFGIWIEWKEAQKLEDRPLLAQCAEVIRACLGNPMATSGIVDELRRVERALAEEGW